MLVVILALTTALASVAWPLVLNVAPKILAFDTKLCVVVTPLFCNDVTVTDVPEIEPLDVRLATVNAPPSVTTPDTLRFPLTSSLAVGAVVPIPMLPVLST